MALTVNTAFEEFLSSAVRLDPDNTEKARKSRDNLISNINSFSGDSDFFILFPDKHLKYGSFARRTKIRPLDDIDLMLCISGEGRTYTQFGDVYCISGLQSDVTKNITFDNTYYLNSTKVINRFIKKLKSLNDYSKAELHKNMEAATLQLKSYIWNFDIVPCWYMDIDKYLIPDGSGYWKLTDPRIDNQRISVINQVHKGKMLDVIRVMKYWNNRAITYTIDSYLLECMILEVYESKNEKDNYWIDIELRDLLKSLADKIMYPVYDPKGVQGDLNSFSSSEKRNISNALSDAYKKACEAIILELENNDQRAAINKWREILGVTFPTFC